jgi:diaminopimelate decarboxylase
MILDQNINFEQIAREYGTPLYLYSGEVLEENYYDLRNKLHPSLELFFSLKSNPNISIYSFLKNLGARAEVSSLAELSTVLTCNTKPENIIFLGPGKKREEIEMCINEGIYAIVCESFQELELINNIAFELNKNVNIALRINPSFTVKGSKLTMGGKSTQFGIDDEILMNTSKGFFNQFTHVTIIGFHTYMGTRILDEDVVIENTKKILSNVEELSQKLNIELRMVDIGGGLGVPYFDKEREINIDRLTEMMNSIISDFREKHPTTRLIMELGRYLTAKSGIYITKALYTKQSRDENFIVADGGTNHHMAAVGIGSFVKRNFPIKLLTNKDGINEHLTYNISGPLCTPNDTIAKKLELPPVSQGDLIGILNSGAYGPTASPTGFLSHGFPAEVLTYQGDQYLIRQRDNVEVILERQCLHEVNMPDLAGVRR